MWNFGLLWCEILPNFQEIYKRMREHSCIQICLFLDGSTVRASLHFRVLSCTVSVLWYLSILHEKYLLDLRYMPHFSWSRSTIETTCSFIELVVVILTFIMMGLSLLACSKHFFAILGLKRNSSTYILLCQTIGHQVVFIHLCGSPKPRT